MKISLYGIEFIKEKEGLRLRPYKDAAGHYTVGYGHRTNDHDKIITKAEATDLLRKDIETIEERLNMWKLKVTQEQYDMLISFTFNLGYSTLLHSGILELLQQEDYPTVGKKILNYNHARVGGALIHLAGLTKRRIEEHIPFMV